jgi:hypothetical protein
MKKQYHKPVVEQLEERAVPAVVAAVPEPTVETIVAAPNNLTAVQSGNQVIVGWNDTSVNETNFAIYRTTNGQTWKQVAILDANSTSYVDKSAGGHKTYTYVIIAYNDNYVSSHFDTVSVTTMKGKGN